MKYIRIIGFVVAILLMCNRLSFAQEEKKPNFTVALDILSSSEDTKATVESYIGRELRSLGDVTIVGKSYNYDSVPDVMIEVLAMEIKSETGGILGYSLSVVVGELLADVIIELSDDINSLYTTMLVRIDMNKEEDATRKLQRLENLMDSNTLKDILDSPLFNELPLPSMFLSEYHKIYNGSPDDLRSMCEEIILNFDNTYLKKKRTSKKIRNENQ